MDGGPSLPFAVGDRTHHPLTRWMALDEKRVAFGAATDTEEALRSYAAGLQVAHLLWATYYEVLTMGYLLWATHYGLLTMAYQPYYGLLTMALWLQVAYLDCYAMRFVKPPAAVGGGAVATDPAPLPLQYSLGAEKARHSRYSHGRYSHSRYRLGAEKARHSRYSHSRYSHGRYSHSRYSLGAEKARLDWSIEPN